jgi:hypothetical protein
MRKVLFILLLILPGILLAQGAQDKEHSATGGVTGRWVVNTDFFGSTIYFKMELQQDGEN